MNKVDEELIARLSEETEREGLQFGDGTDAKTFDAVIKKLIDAPPHPKRKRMAKKRGKR